MNTPGHERWVEVEVHTEGTAQKSSLILYLPGLFMYGIQHVLKLFNTVNNSLCLPPHNAIKENFSLMLTTT